MLNNLAFNLFAVDILDVLVLMILHHKKMFLRFFTNCQIFNSLQAKSNFVGHKIV